MWYFEQKKSDEAQELLQHPERYPALVPRQVGDRKLLIWVFPVFGICTSWSVFQDDGGYVVRRIEWNADKEYASMEVPPATVGSEAKLPTALFESLVARLEDIPYKTFTQGGGTHTDGESYTIQFGQQTSMTQIHWMNWYPAQWQPLKDWFRHASDVFDSVLPQSTCRARADEWRKSLS